MALLGGTSYCIWAWPKGSPDVNMTWCSTVLSHQMHLWGVHLTVSEPDLKEPNVKMTWCSTVLSHQMHLWGVLLIIICLFNWVIDNWTENVCKLNFLCCCCFACVILLLLKQQNYTVTTANTTTTTRFHYSSLNTKCMCRYLFVLVVFHV